MGVIVMTLVFEPSTIRALFTGLTVTGVAHFVLTSFSLKTNIKNLLSASTSADTMTCLHGLRFLSIFWILLGHTYYMKSMSPSLNRVAVRHVSTWAAVRVGHCKRDVKGSDLGPETSNFD
jgi:hypothetical protein